MAFLDFINDPLVNFGLGALSASQQGANLPQGLLHAGTVANLRQRAHDNQALRQNRAALQNQTLELQAALLKRKAAQDAGRQQMAQFLLDNPSADRSQILGELARSGFSDMAAQLALNDNTTSLQKNVTAAGFTPGTPEFQAQILRQMNKPGVTINTGNQTVPINDLMKFVGPKGERPTPGMTADDLVQQGFQLSSTAEQNLQTGSKGALAFIDELEGLAFDEQQPIFQPFTNMAERGRLGVQNARALGNQSNQNLTLYNDLSKSGLSIIVRALGEKGTLNEGDIQRVRNALPKVAPIPDSPEIARQKLSTLRKIVEEVSGRRKGSGSQVRELNGRLFIETSPGEWEEM